MSSDTAGGGALRRGSLRVASLVLTLAGIPVWMLMMQAAGRTWYIEPTDAAIAEAAAARPAALLWAMALMVWAGVLSWATRRRSVTVLALPGLLVALSLLAGTRGDGAALFLGLAASVVALVVVLFLEVRRQRLTSSGHATAR